MRKTLMAWLVAPAFGLAACSHAAPQAPIAAVPPAPPASPVKATEVVFTGGGGGDRLVVSFADGGDRLTTQAQAQLDTAARTYRDGHPLMMYVAGFTDRQGGELANLMLAARRAEAVKAGLIARGIPADRLETAALGEADPAVPTPQGVPEPANRRVVITWK